MQLLVFALLGFSWGHLHLLQGCPFLCIHAAPGATSMSGKASIVQGHITAMLKSNEFEGNVNRTVNVFFTEQVVSTQERVSQTVVLLGRVAVSQQPR